MMRIAGIGMALLLIVACFLPWVSIESRQLSVSGFETAGTNFGKPGLVLVVIASLYILLLLLNKTWSKRTAFFICAISLAWALRNYLIISACYAGECPYKHAGLFLTIVASLGMMFVFILNEMRRTKK